jgi:hypothetical protein
MMEEGGQRLAQAAGRGNGRTMTPLGRVILMAMRWGLWFMAGIIALFFAIEIGKRVGALAQMTRLDITFLAVLAILFLAALWLARAIGRELRN